MRKFLSILQGVSVEDENAEVIFKGFKYWNESLGEYREFFGGYGDRATVEDLEVTLLLFCHEKFLIIVSKRLAPSGNSQQNSHSDYAAVDHFSVFKMFRLLLPVLPTFIIVIYGFV